MSLKNNFSFAVHVLLFEVDNFILPMLDCCGPHVDIIYVAYSIKPWVYNPTSRELLRNTTSVNILEKSQWKNKIVVIEGEWATEEDQRNACLDRARRDKVDFLIIQDADEFYRQSDYASNLEQISKNPSYDFYTTPWCTFWKNLDYVIETKEGIISGYPQFAVNCNRNVRFVNKRSLSSLYSYKLSGLCYHLSYVLSDQAVRKKIDTWGHSLEFDRDWWYANKWLKWHSKMQNLHPVNPDAWKRAVPYPVDDLPEVIYAINCPPVSMYSPKMLDIINEKYTFFCEKISKYKIINNLKKHIFSNSKIKNNLKKSYYFFLHIYVGCLGVCARYVSHVTWKKKVEAHRQQFGSIKIHLGCGNKRYFDMLNCEFRKTPAADIAMDCSSLDRFSSSSAELIYSHAFFEHVYYLRRQSLLVDCCRVLSKSGYIVFHGIPDFYTVAKVYLEQGELCNKVPFTLKTVYRYTHGDPEGAGPLWWKEQLHKSLFDKQTLFSLLAEAGFSGATIFNYRYPNENVPLNLGFVAWKGAHPLNVSKLAEILEPFQAEIFDINDILTSAETIQFSNEKFISKNVNV